MTENPGFSIAFMIVIALFLIRFFFIIIDGITDNYYQKKEKEDSDNE